MKLHDIAHARAGDKGNTSDLTLFAYNMVDYPLLEECVTAGRVKAHFGSLISGEVTRYCLPAFGGLKFVLGDSLGGGVTRSLALDAHGKCFSSMLLAMEITPATPETVSSNE